MSEFGAKNLAESPRLLLLAFACDPERGSEPGAGWNRALQAARFYPTWVLCDEHENRAGIDRYLEKNGPIENLHFVFVPKSNFEERLRRVPGMYYAAYNMWHRRAFQIAKNLHAELHFDLVHQANMCGFREPGYLWQLDAPFVWGPVGGAQNYPWRFLRNAGFKGALTETFRSLANLWQIRYARRVGKAARRASAMLAANATNAKALALRRGEMPLVDLEIGALGYENPPEHNFSHGGPLRILWSGVFEHRKALHLLLEALAQLPETVPFELHILGSGKLETRWRKQALRLGISSCCQWLGFLRHELAIEQYAWADLFAFTSLRDTTGTVVLESLAAGTPILCFDHQGVGDIVTAQCGHKIPVTNPQQAISELRNKLVEWHCNRNELARLSRGALERAEFYSWQRIGDRTAEVYREVLAKNGKPLPKQAAVISDIETPEFAELAGGRT